MKKYIGLAIATLLSGAALSSAVAATDMSAGKQQNAYLAASVSHHELDGEAGLKYGFHIGVKDIYRNNFIVGSELEVAALSNDDFHGLKLGVGADFDLQDWSVGLRYTYADLGGDVLTKEIDDRNLSLLFSYKIKL